MIELKINVKPIGKGRPRFNTYTHRTYTPPKTREYEEAIKKEFMLWYNKEDMYKEEPLEVMIRANFKIPKSYSKRQYGECVGKPYQHKPDTDNIAKAVLDALNGLAYKDDTQVVKLKVEKLYNEYEDYVYIEIKEYK